MSLLAACAVGALWGAADPIARESAAESPLADLYRYVDWGRALDGLGSSTGRVERLFEGLSLRPVILSESDERAAGPVLGVEYDFQKNLATPIVLGDERATGIALDLIGRGTVAFERNQNPHDLLETGLRLSLFGSFSSSSAAVGDFERRARAPDADDATKRAYTELLQRSDALLATISSDPSAANSSSKYAAAVKSPEFQKFLAENPEGYLGQRTTWTWHADLKANYETNQEFTERQGALGLRVGATGFSDDPDVAGWNFADYPFAITRWLTGAEDASRMRGHFPRVTLGFDLVDPSQDGDREAAGEDLDVYPRIAAEIGYATDFGAIRGRELKASVDWRYFEELDPASGVEDADLDRTEYFSAALTDVDSGVFFSYSTGALPLDSTNDSVFAIGWNFSK